VLNNDQENMTALTGTLVEPAGEIPAKATRHGAPHRNRGDRWFFFILRGGALLPALLMLLFVAVLIYGALPSIKQFGISFLFTSEWDPAEDREAYGALASIYGTLFSSLMALAIAGPIGIGVAAYLNEVFPARLRGTVVFLIEILATIPSIVYGIWAFFLLVPFIADYVQPLFTALPWCRNFFLFKGPPIGVGLLAGTIILAVMILPLIVSISLDAIRAVPASYREAALGLGATRWEMIRLAVLPAARSGLMGACILALGRALGETMAITMIIGNSNLIKWSLFEPATTISSLIANNFNEASGLMRSALIELALILFVMTLVVNLAARFLMLRFAGTKGVAQ
jgi:phosphate transport system permease protein